MNTNTGKVILKDIVLFGHHGVFDTEKEVGQEFVCDVELVTDFGEAIKSDDIADVLDYADVYDVVKNIISGEKKFNLIESLADAIIVKLFADFEQVVSIHILIKKPQAPIDGEFDYMGVELSRDRA